MDRREFIVRSLLGLGAVLVAPDIVWARDRRVADFLSRYQPIYDENQDWNFGQGRLLIGLHGQLGGNYHIFVDNQWVAHSADDVHFDWRYQRLRIERNGQVVLNHDPRLQVAPQALR